METLSVGTVLGSGQPWSQQYDINLESNSVLGEWGEVGNLPITLSDSSVIVTRNRVFLLGEWNGSVSFSTIQTATINADGTLGSWSTAGSLPSAFEYSSIIVTRNRVFLLGGWNGGTSIATIHTATINADGTLGAWSTAGNLPSGLSSSSVVVTRNRVFLLGGWQNGVGVISTIHTATINADGTLGAWTTAGNLPSAFWGSSVIVTRNRVFLLGGRNVGAISTIFTAPINADGTLGTWTTAGNLPSVLAHSNAIVTRNRVFLLGGDNGNTAISSIYSASFTGGLNDYSEFYDNDVE